MNLKETDMGWGPDYGPWMYELLEEPQLSSELARISAAESIGNAACVAFQPCPDPEAAIQDRHAVLYWDLPGGTWTFLGVFDGHAGHETVDHTVATLPFVIKALLASALAKTNSLPPATVSDIIIEGISDFDESLCRDLIDLFPGGLEALSDNEIRAVINDTDSGGKNSTKVMRCMRGSTALIALIDPTGENVYVGSLGDCAAVLGTESSGNIWRSSVLSSYHNGTDASEVERIRREHPGENECILNHRVLGAIAVTRAVGDHLFKLPAVYTERVFNLAKPGFRLSTKVEDFLYRNKTPPYLSNKPSVRHVDIKSLGASKSFLILCSDGLIDLYDSVGGLEAMADAWVQIVSKAELRDSNRALHLLREGIGGQNAAEVSRNLTVQMTERWMDDTTIIVYPLL